MKASWQLIFELLHRQPPQTIVAMTERCGLARSQLHPILKVLERDGHAQQVRLERIGSPGLWSLTQRGERELPRRVSDARVRAEKQAAREAS
jgi:DNA-binding MarR family transcriptional regulator